MSLIDMIITWIEKTVKQKIKIILQYICQLLKTLTIC